MDLREPAQCRVTIESGRLAGATGRYEKRLSELAGLYEDEAAFAELIESSGDRVVYEVTEYRPSTDTGDLIFGVTRMMPGRVGHEFFLTRGHLHAKADRPEIYYGQKGCGLMLMESPVGDSRVVEITPQTICYVPPYWIHRSINTGPDELVMVFAYPADAGQDYEIIARSGGMRHRVMSDGGDGWVLVENRRYRPRTNGDGVP